MLQPLTSCLAVGLRMRNAVVPALISRVHVRKQHGTYNCKTQIRRSGLAARRTCRSCLSQEALHTAPASQRERIVELARKAAVQAMPPQSVVKVQGHGKQMGMTVAWQLIIGHEGACQQNVEGKELSFRWGTEGNSNPNAWEEDDTGIARTLQLDDNEALLIAEWVKTGMWLSPSVAQLLDIQCLSDQEAELHGKDMPDPQAKQSDSSKLHSSSSSIQRSATSLHQPMDGPSTSEPTGAATATALPAVGPPPLRPSGAPRQPSSTAAQQQHSVSEDSAMQIDWDRAGESSDSSTARSGSNGSTVRGSSGDADHPRDNSGDADHSQKSLGLEGKTYVVLAVKLRSGKIVNQVRLCTTTWRPLAVLQPICGETVTWHYVDWREWIPEFHFPSEHHQLTPSGGDNSFIATSVKREDAPQLSTFIMPQPPLTPPDTHFDPQASPLVQAWHTASGHVLVQPSVNGRSLGYMMLDTGASGLVIEEAIANELELRAFGEMYVTGMAGSLRCQFRRAKELKLGPVTIERPLFMQMSLSGVVNGAPGPVIGILGYDLFRRCVMQLPPSSHDASKAPFQLSMFDPYTFQNPQHLNHRWQALSMVANLPHIEVSLTVNPDSKPVKCLLMLDSGAGGVDAMFHKRAATELGLIHSNRHGMRTLRGVGGSEVGGMRVKSAKLHSMDLSDHQFNTVRCLFTDSDGLDHTMYSSGILCGDIMNRCTVVLDYARNRIMFVPKDQEGSTM